MTSADAALGRKELNYGYGRLFDLPFREVLDRTKEALLTEGFGVLFEIDLREKFREKLGTDFKEYVILGVCNPWLAYETLQQEIGVGPASVQCHRVRRTGPMCGCGHRRREDAIGCREL